MIYLGTLGRMIGIKCPASQTVEHGSRYTLKPTLEGGVRAQARPSSARQWQLGLSDASTPKDVALLQDFVRGAWGVGPWWFLSAEAVNTNILTPRQAALVDREQRADLIDGGPVLISDGSTAPKSVMVTYVSTNDVPIIRRLPITPGGAVTFTAEAESDGTVAPQIWVAFYDTSGANIRGHYGVGQVRAGMQKVSVSNVAPPNAYYVSVGASTQTIRLARPQVTWTDAAPPVFSDGRGCAAAVVHSVSEGAVLTTATNTFLNAGFTVSEVI